MNKNLEFKEIYNAEVAGYADEANIFSFHTLSDNLRIREAEATLHLLNLFSGGRGSHHL